MVAQQNQMRDAAIHHSPSFFDWECCTVRRVLTHESHTLGREKRRYPVFRKLAESSLYDVYMRELGFVNHSWITANGIQDFF